MQARLCTALLPIVVSLLHGCEDRALRGLAVEQSPLAQTLIVRYLSGARPAHPPLARVHRRASRSVPDLEILVLDDQASTEEALRQLRRRPDVAYVERDRYVELLESPDDPDFDDQWALENTGQTGGVADMDINAAAAWDVTAGDPSVVVVTLDTGIDYTHPDLAANVWVNPDEIAGNGLDDDGNGYIDDVHGINVSPGATAGGDPLDDHVTSHGTKVAGIIAARGDNGLGVSGVAQVASLAACKFLSGTGGGTLAGAITCLDYAYELRQRGFNVVATNNSWGSVWHSRAVRDAVAAQLEQGILFVAAAGNSGFDNDDTSGFVYPATLDLPHVISVTVVDAYGQVPASSSYGRHTVHLGAPAENVLTTLRGGSYGTGGATSIAAPHVTGAVALLAAARPDADWRELRNLVLAGAAPTPALAGITVAGGRLRLWDEDGRGALTCLDQQLVTRLRPTGAEVVAARGVSRVPLEVLSLRCAASEGPVEVAAGAGTIALADDGLTDDDVALDGNFSATFDVPGDAATSYTLTFPGDDDVVVRVLNPYRAAEPDSEAPRAITGTALGLVDTQAALVTLPFAVPFGDDAAGFTQLWVASDGTLSFTDRTSVPENEPLPSSAHATFIAPFWSDLNPASAGDVLWEVVGSAPSRELVVEWRGVVPTGSLDPVSFQVVLFEASSDVLYLYSDVDVAGSSADQGGLATIGLQVAADAGLTLGHAAPVLTSGTALRWRTNSPPLADPGAGQTVDEGAPVTLDGSASTDANGFATLTPMWTQLSGAPVSLDDPGTWTPSFTAPAVPGELTFSLLVEDDLGATSRATTLVTVAGIAPTLTLLSVSPASVPEGAPVAVRVDASDGSSTASRLRLDWSWSSEWVASEVLPGPGEGSAEHAFADDSGGGHGVTVQVTDRVDETGASSPLSLSSELFVALEVVNVVPDFVPVAPADLVEASQLELALGATDPGGFADPLIFSLIDGPLGMTVTAAGALTYTPAYEDADPAWNNPGQTHLVSVGVEDDDGGRDEMGFIITVFWRDADNDHMADAWELDHGLDPASDDAADDHDGDGHSNLEEFVSSHGGARLRRPGADHRARGGGGCASVGGEGLSSAVAVLLWRRRRQSTQ